MVFGAPFTLAPQSWVQKYGCAAQNPQTNDWYISFLNTSVLLLSRSAVQMPSWSFLLHFRGFSSCFMDQKLPYFCISSSFFHHTSFYSFKGFFKGLDIITWTSFSKVPFHLWVHMTLYRSPFCSSLLGLLYLIFQIHIISHNIPQKKRTLRATVF